MLPDIDRVTATIREVAETEILPRFRHLATGEVRQKTGPEDLVTIADEASERALSERLPGLLPGSAVLGEEAVAADPRVLDRIHGSAPVWVIDPVDGTMNFASGRPTFGVIVALVRDGVTVAGWIHDPLGARTAIAVRGEGAWMEGRRLRVAAPVPVPEMEGALSIRYCDEPIAGRLKERCGGIGRSVTLGCAAHEYLRLVTGEAHFSLYHKLMPWDHAAGALIHAEAGGHAALTDGSPYQPTVTTGHLLLTPDAESWSALHAHLFG